MEPSPPQSLVHSHRQAASKVTVVEQALETVRARIMCGLYAPGQRLVESDLMAELQISRGPVREVLRRLFAEGLIDIEPYRGATVCRLTREGLLEVFQIREPLEALAAGLASQNVGGKNSPQAEKLKTLANFGAVTRDDYMEKNAKLHQYIVSLSGNQRLQRILSLLELPALRVYFPMVLNQQTMKSSEVEHHELVQAICAGDAALASAIAKKHVQRTAQLAQTLPDLLFPHRTK